MLSYSTLIRIHFVMLGLGLVFLLSLFATALFLRQVYDSIKVIMASGALLSFSLSFSVNALCGIIHKKMTLRNFMSIETDEPFMFYLLVLSQIVMGVIALIAAVQIITGAVPISL